MVNKKFILSLIAISTMMCSQENYANPQGIVHENYTLDVYRSNQINAGTLDLRYGDVFKQVADVMLYSKTTSTDARAKEVWEKAGKVLEEISKSGKFAFFSLGTVIYPGSNQIGITIDVVDKGDEKRMRGFLPKPTDTFPDPKNLIHDWQQYEKYGFNYIYNNKKMTYSAHCSAYHCLYGFDDPEVRQYGDKFNRYVPKYKKELIAILRRDKDDAKRGAAAFLLAHLKDANEVVAVLTPSMRDSSGLVRNNSMRVLAATAAKAKVAYFPIDGAIRALTYPTETDRNKALFMLESITRTPKYASYVKKNGCREVLDQFRLVQLNIHDTSYRVFMNISGENFPSSDYSAWEKWATQHCPQLMNG